MLLNWPLRVKLCIGLGLLLAMVAILSSGGLYSAYAYRTLVKALSWRVSELPLASELSARVADMRVTFTDIRGGAPAQRVDGGSSDAQAEQISRRVRKAGGQFAEQLHAVE